jgi:hypothetical protein
MTLMIQAGLTLVTDICIVNEKDYIPRDFVAIDSTADSSECWTNIGKWTWNGLSRGEGLAQEVLLHPHVATGQRDRCRLGSDHLGEAEEGSDGLFPRRVL